MEISETLYVKNRKQWRAWLKKNHAAAKDIWLIYYKKNSGKSRIAYNDAVDEALCFGWIDSTIKKLDEHSYLQRFSPRRKNSRLSELNKERVRRLIKAGEMTPSGIEAIKHHFGNNSKVVIPHPKSYKIPEDILKELKRDKIVWNNFRKFPDSYKSIRIGWIDSSRKREDVFQTRLKYFIKMTSRNKMFGMVR